MAALPRQVHVSDHPVLSHKMTRLRDMRSDSRDFRDLLKEISFYLGYEATSSLELCDKVVETSQCQFNGSKLSQKIGIVPIMRAGLGMVEGMLDLLPNASVHHIGMYRSKASLLPVQYYNKLPRTETVDVAIILDVMLATSATLKAVCSIIKQWCNPKIIVVSVLASRQGIDNLVTAHPDVSLHVAQIDDGLSADGDVLPGLGDAGDRLYGRNDVDDEHPVEKRKSEVVVDVPRKKAARGKNKT